MYDGNRYYIKSKNIKIFMKFVNGIQDSVYWDKIKKKINKHKFSHECIFTKYNNKKNIKTRHVTVASKDKILAT